LLLLLSLNMIGGGGLGNLGVAPRPAEDSVA
jgi:hypothetical protein